MTPKFPPSSTSNVFKGLHFLLKEALAAVVAEGEICVEALLWKVEVTFTRSSDKVVVDVIRKCLYGLFLWTVMKGLTVLIVFSIWLLGETLGITTVSAKANLPSPQDILTSSWRSISLLISPCCVLLVIPPPRKFIASCSVQQQAA